MNHAHIEQHRIHMGTETQKRWLVDSCSYRAGERIHMGVETHRFEKMAG